MARAEFDGEGSYDVTEPAPPMRSARRASGPANGSPGRRPRQAHRPAGPQGAGGSPGRGHGQGSRGLRVRLAIASYDSLSADEVQGKLAELSQIDLAKVKAYERKNQNRSTITSRIDSLQGDEPWPGYDELSVDEVRAVLSEADDQRVKDVRALRAPAQGPRGSDGGDRAPAQQRLRSLEL